MLDRDPLPGELKASLNAAQKRFDLCIIDTPPAASEWLSEALVAADLVLIPVRPSPDDLRSVGATLAAVNGSGMPFAFILSQTPRARITEEAARVLAQHGRLAPVTEMVPRGPKRVSAYSYEAFVVQRDGGGAVRTEPGSSEQSSTIDAKTPATVSTKPSGSRAASLAESQEPPNKGGSIPASRQPRLIALRVRGSSPSIASVIEVE